MASRERLSLEEEQFGLVSRLMRLGVLQTQGLEVNEEIMEVERQLMEIAEAKADIGRLYKTNTHP